MTAPADHLPVTVMGLGKMGTAVAQKLLAHGHPTTVWNRTPERAEALQVSGAQPSASIKDAVSAGLLILICLKDQAAVNTLLTPLKDRIEGRVIVNLTGGTPAQARTLAAWAAGQGAAYVSCNILGDPEQIGTPAARFYYSGDTKAYEQHRQTLFVLGEEATYYGPDAGLAPVYYMALIGLSYELWFSYLQTLAFVSSEGGDPKTFAPDATSVLEPTLALLEEFARAAEARDYPPVAGPLRTHAALMPDLLEAWHPRKDSRKRLEHIQKWIDQRVAEGHGDEGFSSLIELTEP